MFIISPKINPYWDITLVKLLVNWTFMNFFISHLPKLEIKVSWYIGFILSLGFSKFIKLLFHGFELTNYHLTIFMIWFFTCVTTWFMIDMAYPVFIANPALTIRIQMKYHICDTSLKLIMTRAVWCHVCELGLCHLVFMTGYLMRTLPPL